MLPTESTSAQARTRRLRRFIGLLLPFVVGFGIAFTGAGLALGQPGLAGTGLIVGAYGLVLAYAQRLARRGDDARAVTLTYVGMLLAALLIVPIQPELFPTLALVPLIAAGVTLPFQSGRRLRRVLTLCCLTSAGVMAVGDVLVTIRPVSHAIPVGLSISSYAVAVGFVGLLLWQFSSQLLEALAESRAANEAQQRAHALERQLGERQRLESLGVLAGGIAHDFNNLLGVIIGYTHLLRTATTVEDAEHALQEIEGAAERAAVLTRQMLAYAGQGNLVLAMVDINQVVRAVATQATVGRKSAGVWCVLGEGLPPVHGDAEQLRQAILNLVVNAVEATERPGMVRVSTRHLEARPEPLALSHSFLGPHPYGLVCIEVYDDGHGMDHETLTRVLDPFFSTRFPGRGLGLAAVLGIVRSHGGALDAESTPGRGSRFRVLLPAIDQRLREGHLDNDRPDMKVTV